MSSSVHKNIVWIASYPKSGNTWFRIFLSNLLGDLHTPADINNLYRTPIASGRTLFDDISALGSSDLTHDEIDNLRPLIYREISASTNQTIYHKVHDMCHKNRNGEWLFPPDITRKVIYILRNPFDVAVSFANHLSCPIDDAIKKMNNPEGSFCSNSNRLYNQLRQKLGSWSDHVKSWTGNNEYNLLTIRYEDMHLKPLETFKKAVQFLELDKKEEQILKAIEYSKLENIQNQESEKGFKEKPPKTGNFFRKGTINDWKQALNHDQFDQLLKKHDQIIKRYSYL